MVEGGLIFGLVRSGHFLISKMWRQLFPRASVEAIPLFRGHVELGNDILLINTSQEPINKAAAVELIGKRVELHPSLRYLDFE